MSHYLLFSSTSFAVLGGLTVLAQSYRHWKRGVLAVVPGKAMMRWGLALTAAWWCLRPLLDYGCAIQFVQFLLRTFLLTVSVITWSALAFLGRCLRHDSVASAGGLAARAAALLVAVGSSSVLCLVVGW
jgi:hypothetical protein